MGRQSILRSLALLVAGAPLAAGELSFTDITAAAGVGGPAGDRTGGHGVMFADADGDGRPDLYITMIFTVPMPDLFFRNLDGARFADEGAARGIDDLDGGSHGACWADLDSDGDYDLVNGATWDSDEHPAVNDVFVNDGGGRFTRLAESGIPSERSWLTRGVLALDLDRDGDLDLFCVTNYRGSEDPPDERNEVYLNDGRGRFTPVDGGALGTAPCGQGAVDTDFDGDGDVDVLAANRTGPVNVLRNDGAGSFERVAPESLGIRHRAGDGITTADVDADGDLDLLLAGDDVGHLYENLGDGAFAHRRSFSGIDGYMGGFADLDNDGDLDLVFAGEGRAWLNDGSGRFAEGPAVPVEGIDDPRAIAFADIDGDGDLDFAIGCKRSQNRLVRNDLDGGGNWLRVRLVSPTGQAGAFGARVTVFAAGGDGDSRARRRLGLREARSNAGYLGQDDPVLHFGLGERERADLVVRFLDGTVVERAGARAGGTVIIDGRSGEEAR